MTPGNRFEGDEKTHLLLDNNRQGVLSMKNAKKRDLKREDHVINWVSKLKQAFEEINVRIADKEYAQFCYDWLNYQFIRIHLPTQNVTVLINPVAEKKWPITVTANESIVATFTWWLNTKILK